MSSLTRADDDDDDEGLRLDFHRRFGESLTLKATEGDEDETDEARAMSAIEKAAEKDAAVTMLMEMFPAWSKDDVTALLSSCGDSVEETTEEIMRLGEGGAAFGEADFAQQLALEEFADEDARAAAALAEDRQEAFLDLRHGQMLREQVDDYERHVMAMLKDGDQAPPPEYMSIALTVPTDAEPGGSLRVRMLDGAEYMVRIPAGVEPGHKFLAHFPVVAARQGDSGAGGAKGDDFLSVVEGDADAQLRAALEESRAETAGGRVSPGGSTGSHADAEMAAALRESRAGMEAARGRLVEMGFSEAQAEAALEQNGGDESRALDCLLAAKGNENTLLSGE